MSDTNVPARVRAAARRTKPSLAALVTAVDRENGFMDCWKGSESLRNDLSLYSLSNFDSIFPAHGKARKGRAGVDLVSV